MKLFQTLGLPACNVIVELQFPRNDQSQAKSISVDYKAHLARCQSVPAQNKTVFSADL